VSGFTWLISALSNRRGRAITFVFLVLVILFLLHYLAQFWTPLHKIVFLSPLHYYRPAQVLTGVDFPWRDLAVLVSFGAATWLAGGIVFSRRDLCTI
jgi:hypothetical protein